MPCSTVNATQRAKTDASSLTKEPDMYDLYIGNKNYSSWSLRPLSLIHI